MVPPVVVYQSAVRDGDRVFTSGQLPMKDGQLMTPGKLGGAVSEEEGYAAARQCALNALAAIKKQVGALSAIKRVVKVIVFMARNPASPHSRKSPTGPPSSLAKCSAPSSRASRAGLPHRDDGYAGGRLSRADDLPAG